MATAVDIYLSANGWCFKKKQFELAHCLQRTARQMRFHGKWFVKMQPSGFTAPLFFISRSVTMPGERALRRLLPSGGHLTIGCQSVGFSGAAVLAGPCSLASEAMKGWAERYVSTGFMIACISTALVWTCSLAIAILHLAALVTRP
jgi:hypothetical protein